jgi:hypothetical protein
MGISVLGIIDPVERELITLPLIIRGRVGVEIVHLIQD